MSKQRSLSLALIIALTLTACARKTSVTPAPGAPAPGTPAAQTPAAGTPGAQTPAAQTPAAGSPAAGTPAGQTPAPGTPAAQPVAALISETPAKPDLVPVLWMTVTSDGTKDDKGDYKIVGEVHVTQSQPFTEEKNAVDSKGGRIISHHFQIKNAKGETTSGHFQFRHPYRGVLEGFHLEDGVREIDEKQVAARPFAIELKLPIDDVSDDLLLHFTKDVEDFKRREEALKAKPGDSVLMRKYIESIARLVYSKEELKKAILDPAFEAWSQTYEAEKGAEWVYDKRLADQKEIFRYLDDHIDQLRAEYEKVKQNQAKYRQQLAGLKTGQPIPVPPAPPPSNDAEINAADMRVLQTDGLANAPSLAQPNRVRLVFVSEAFTAAEREKFFLEAQKKWDFLFGSEKSGEKGVDPFRPYRSYFMGVAIFIPSKESGSCYPWSGSSHCKIEQTAFGSTFGTAGQRRLTSLSWKGAARLSALLATKMPNYGGTATVLINDDEYGGSGGSFATVSLNSESNEILAHEMIGHVFAALGDEYDRPPYERYNKAKPAEDPNTTTDSTGAKWAVRFVGHPGTESLPREELIEKIVQGARYDPNNWYRPFHSCKMRELADEFCPVCRDTVIGSVYRLVKLIDAVSPNSEKVEAKAGTDWELKVQTLRPLPPGNISIQWLLIDKDGGQRVLEGQTQETLKGSSLNLDKGKYTIRVLVRDTNPQYLPKAAPENNLLERSYDWKVEIKK